MSVRVLDEKDDGSITVAVDGNVLWFETRAEFRKYIQDASECARDEHPNG